MASSGVDYYFAGVVDSREALKAELSSVPSTFMKSILILESSNEVSQSLAHNLERRGWNVTSCDDRERAISRLAGDFPWGVILLSYSVPGRDGIRLIKFIRGLDHRRMTAVVMVTDCSEAIEKALSAGADEVLLEPIDPNALAAVVDRHFS